MPNKRIRNKIAKREAANQAASQAKAAVSTATAASLDPVPPSLCEGKAVLDVPTQTADDPAATPPTTRTEG